VRTLEALGWAVVHALWLGVLVQLAWRTIERGLRDAGARYRVAAGLLAGFGIFFAGTAALFMSAKGGHLPAEVVPQVLPVPLAGTEAAYGALLPETPLPPVLRMLGALWATGSVLLLGRLLGGWQVAMRTYLRGACAARAEWQRVVGDVSRRIDVASPRVLESAGLGSPAVVGFLRPVLVLPADRLDMLDRTELRAIIAHELTHVRRRDNLVNLLQCAAEALCFFHPVVWRLSAALRLEREKICDLAASAATPDPRTYVRGLLKLEQLRVQGVHAIGARAGASLLARVRYLLEQNGEPAARRITAPALALLLVATLGAAVAVPPTLRTAARSTGADVVRIAAADPAGPFTVTFRYGRIVHATLDGASVPRSRLRQRGDSLIFLDARLSRDFAVRVDPAGGISWVPRQASTP
jgi:beta-lactamase regulating signal transducer with metallopeptidase domain